jgi:hypothetical protein
MSLIQEPRKTFKLFYSYAPEDRTLQNKLEKHLSAFLRQGEIIGWHHDNINPGQESEYEVVSNLNTSSIILLLISQYYIASDYHYNVEMRCALARRDAGKAIIVPIILRPCVWNELPFGIYEALPSNEKAVISWSNQDAAFYDIAQGIKKVVQNLREHLEEMKLNQANTKPKSIYPNRANLQEHKTVNVNQATPKTAKAQNIRGNATNSRTNPQLAEKRVISASWNRKSLPKLRNFSKLMRKYFSLRNFNKYTKGIYGIMFLFFLALDVGGLTIVSKDWQIFPQQPAFAVIIPSFMFLWGISNKNSLIAMLLATAIGITWLFVGFHYLPWHPITIPIAILIVSLILTIARFFFFQNH